MNPLVSVVIPVFNGEKYLKKSIESVLAQTYKNIEIICVNDGSTDNSLCILQEYQKKYPNIKVISQENRGLSAALNSAIKIMNGKYLKKVDADDIYYSNAIEEFVSLAEEFNGNDIIYSNFDYMDLEDRITKHYMYENYDHLDKLSINLILLSNGMYGNLGFDFIPKYIFDKCGVYDETIRLNEDYEMQLRLCILYGVNLRLVPKSLFKVRIHPDSLTRNNIYSGERRNEIIRKSILKQLDQNDQQYYKIEMKKLWKKIPLRTKFRRAYQKILLNILGESLTNKCLKLYMKKIKHNNLEMGGGGGEWIDM